MPTVVLLSLHEPLKFLRSHLAILICIYDVEDALVDRRHLVERERAIAIRVGNGEHDLHHVTTTHHPACLAHAAHVAHHSTHTAPASHHAALPHAALPHGGLSPMAGLPHASHHAGLSRLCALPRRAHRSRRCLGVRAG